MGIEAGIIRIPVQLPERVYLVGFSEHQLGRLIGILVDERDRLETRRKGCQDVQLAVDLTEDIQEIQGSIDVLENIKEGLGPNIFDRRMG